MSIMENSVIYSPRAMKVYDDAARVYGRKMQLVVCAEECNELSKEVLKLIRNSIYGVGDTRVYDNVADEVADVMIMCAQVARMLKIEALVEEHADKKIQRLAIMVERQMAFDENRLAKL